MPTHTTWFPLGAYWHHVLRRPAEADGPSRQAMTSQAEVYPRGLKIPEGEVTYSFPITDKSPSACKGGP